MKMYVFPREDSTDSLDTEQKRYLVNPDLDAALVRVCTFLLAWAAGASTAVLLVVAT